MALIQVPDKGAQISPDGQISDEGQQQQQKPDVQPLEQHDDQPQQVPDDQQGNEQQQPEDTTDVSMDLFNAAKNLKLTEEFKRPEVKSDKDKQQKPEDKTDDQEDLNKPQPQEQKQQKQTPESRDFTGLDSSLHPHFKRMSNEAFNTLKPYVIELQGKLAEKDKEIADIKKGKIPDNYYEHERGFTLTPEYENAAMYAHEAALIHQHWEQQLNAVREGAKEYVTLARDAKGNLVYGAKAPADASAETKLLSLFTSTQAQMLQAQGELNGVQKAYKSNYESARDWVGTYSDKVFPAFKDEKGALAIAANNYVNKEVPAAFRSNPLAPLLAKSVITGVNLFRLLKEAKEQLEGKGGQQQRQVQQKQQRRQPNDADLGGDDGGQQQNKGGAGEVTMDDFNAVKYTL